MKGRLRFDLTQIDIHVISLFVLVILKVSFFIYDLSLLFMYWKLAQQIDWQLTPCVKLTDRQAGTVSASH